MPKEWRCSKPLVPVRAPCGNLLDLSWCYAVSLLVWRQTKLPLMTGCTESLTSTWGHYSHSSPMSPLLLSNSKCHTKCLPQLEQNFLGEQMFYLAWILIWPVFLGSTVLDLYHLSVLPHLTLHFSPLLFSFLFVFSIYLLLIFLFCHPYQHYCSFSFHFFFFSSWVAAKVHTNH